MTQANPPKFCPICKKPASEKFGPFCSARCANIDLGRWLGGKYAVETDEKSEDRQQNKESGIE